MNKCGFVKIQVRFPAGPAVARPLGAGRGGASSSPTAEHSHVMPCRRCSPSLQAWDRPKTRQNPPGWICEDLCRYLSHWGRPTHVLPNQEVPLRATVKRRAGMHTLASAETRVCVQLRLTLVPTVASLSLIARTVLEAVQRLLPCALRHVTVQAASGHAAAKRALKSDKVQSPDEHNVARASKQRHLLTLSTAVFLLIFSCSQTPAPCAFSSNALSYMWPPLTCFLTGWLPGHWRRSLCL